jgi:hypothetical protein
MISPNFTNCFIMLMCTTSRPTPPIFISSHRDVERRPRKERRSMFCSAHGRRRRLRMYLREGERRREGG